MNLNQRIEAFAKLGEFLSQFSSEKIEKKEDSEFNNLFFEAFKMQLERASEYNGWFTKNNVLNAFENWSKTLTKSNLNKWTSTYAFNIKNPKKIAVIMAGNIPLVGFHDFLSVLISGHNITVKLSSNDQHFIPLVAKFLEYYNEEFKGKITFSKEKLTDFDAVIATGSNNTARYFEHYFGKYPHIIRKNRNSVAILTGKETQEELALLGEDIFQFFGLGCRSISKLFVPKGYNFDTFFKAIYKFNTIIEYKKYENNYNYNKAVYLMSLFKLQENGFLMLKEDSQFASPIATLFYEYYDDFENLLKNLQQNSDKIQCIVSNENVVDFVKFGNSQKPELWNYADNIDTIKFLLKL
ncbi:acyl-CoA reductase [Lutibacter sp. TH_r2]|uniref:acyl-CoA reductase n=1 Tax=Lutibacter sp. TH_r2 TaxID=3082083 RepID=UPI002952ACAC|nr:acyl-CoA reductase [Lutibacter sp. TH_r2]MDV7187533.1 acyl-CoA reductase [Lutibacter sp. TH_r2]